MKSKNFKEDEIKGITLEDGKKVIYLKEGVKRNPKYDYLTSDNLTHINQEMITYEKNKAVLTYFFSLDDFTDEDTY